MASPKKHHYTPNFILRRFVDPKSQTLWVWDKHQQVCRPNKGGGKGRYEDFAENHYNTVVDSKGEKDLSVEYYCTDVETKAISVVDELVRVAQAGFLPTMGYVDKESLCRLLWIQHVRSPYTRAQIASDEKTRQMALDAIVRVVHNVGAETSLIAHFERDIESMVSTACKTMIKMQDFHGGALHHMTSRMSLDVGIVRPAVNTHFVTSDRPCLISPMLRPGGMVCMPVAQDVDCPTIPSRRVARRPALAQS